MLKNFNVDGNNFIIDSEDKLLDVFGILIDNGLEPDNAYDFIVQKYGEEIISKFLVCEDLNLGDVNVIK